MKEGLPLGPTVQKVDTVRREFGAFRFSTPRSRDGFQLFIAKDVSPAGYKSKKQIDDHIPI